MDIDDTISMLLQQAARRDSQRVFPVPNRYTNMDKMIGMMERRKFIKRIPVSNREDFHKVVKGVGAVNYEITSGGLEAISW